MRPHRRCWRCDAKPVSFKNGFHMWRACCPKCPREDGGPFARDYGCGTSQAKALRDWDALVDGKVAA